MNFDIFLTLYHSKVTIIYQVFDMSFNILFVRQFCVQLVLHDYWKCKNYIV